MTVIIFDCDGVLIDSELIACAADADALSSIGYPISCDEVVERFSGLPSDAMYTIIESELGHALPADYFEQVNQKLLEKYRANLDAIDGAAEVLSSLRAPICVASSSTPAKLARGLLETDLFELLYPNIFSTALVERGKPHPDLFLYAAKAMGAETSECIVVEDSVAGVTAARHAGITSIGFVGGSHCLPDHADRLVQAGAETVISDLRQLSNVILI